MERLAMSLDKAKCARVAAIATGITMMCATGMMAQSPEKQPESYQTFYLKNATGQNAANDIQTSMRNMLPRARIYYAPTANALSLSGSAEDIAQAQKILADVDKPQRVYRVTYTISDGHGASRHIALLLAPGKRAISKQGTRVPIMTGSYREGGGEPPNTQFQYVDVGLSAEASLEGYGDGLRLMSKIEETGVSEQKSNVGLQDPIVDQSVLEAQSTVRSDKPVMLGSIDIPGGKHMDVRVTIEVVQ
jgi:type II secretory pathway component GspD/PulD (secretin)